MNARSKMNSNLLKDMQAKTIQNKLRNEDSK
eukprot:CAMPEP_0115590880 /NCGR_PEP_ID=MMETSP0272-20121206/9991_1 /TAXON_ID=71861 /ORGANISM="Scrippsiella trochoidea, Strain CCMP3099" /LENGTH=30 /DNA_ID= /DNA_START= /DNA_END= /DNA_ORIENTATION=